MANTLTPAEESATEHNAFGRVFAVRDGPAGGDDGDVPCWAKCMRHSPALLYDGEVSLS